MTDDLSNIFEEAEHYLNSALRRWRTQLPELYEDARQEGMIQVWRDIEAGEPVKLKILRRASQKANTFCHRNGEYYYGRPTKSREGISSRSKTQEKVQIYLQEYLDLNDNAWPTPIEVSRALGISDSFASIQLKRIKEGRVDHMKYRPDGRMDWDYYHVHSVEALASANGEGRVNRHWSDDPKMPNDSFEDLLVSELDLENLMKALTERHRTILYLVFYQGYTAIDIGRHLGFTANISTKGERNIKNAINQARIFLFPYQGACTKDHARTSENTIVNNRSDGVYTRLCRDCRSSNAVATTAKVKAEGTKTGRKEKPYCPKNHLKTKRDSHGRLRCDECRRESQKKYYHENKEYYKEYQKKYRQPDTEE